jgi:hypothetical protein
VFDRKPSGALPQEKPRRMGPCFRKDDDEALTLFLAGQLICPSCQYAAGFFSCDDGQITGTFPRVFCPHEGRFAIVTKRWSEDAVDATGAKDERACRGRRSRGVLIPRRWYQALKKLTLLRGDGDNKPALRGDHEGNR